jgi:hypothetical protein
LVSHGKEYLVPKSFSAAVGDAAGVIPGIGDGETTLDGVSPVGDDLIDEAKGA